MAINVSLANLSTLNNTSILTQSNSNFATIQSSLVNALSLNGQTPNQMQSVLDMNGNQVLNLPSPATVNSPARLVDVVSNPTITVPPVGTSGATVPLLNANNTFSGTQTFSGNTVFNGSNTFNGSTIFNGPIGPSFLAAFHASGRLTIQTGTPVFGNNSVTGSNTVYWTPYKGRFIPIYNGTNMVMVDYGGELSQTTTDTTKSPAAVAVNSIYDVFVWIDTGNTFRATRGPAWTNSTTRSLGLTYISGVPTNSTSITNGPLANMGTYVGTIASNGTSTIDWIIGGFASGGSPARLMVWNYWNRVVIGVSSIDNGGAYTYATNTTREARGSTGNQINWVTGVSEDSYLITSQSSVRTTAVNTSTSSVGLAFNSTTTFNDSVNIETFSATQVQATGFCQFQQVPSIGTNFVARLELGDGANANTLGFANDQLNFIFPM
jgi:hypothetical protein